MADHRCPHCGSDLQLWGLNHRGTVICTHCSRAVSGTADQSDLNTSAQPSVSSDKQPHSGRRRATNTNPNQAELAYSIIAGKANLNSFGQALTGLAGFPWTLAADAAVIPTIYIPLWNDIRRLYGYSPVESSSLGGVVTRVLPEILADLLLDKFLGNVPGIGIYFNAICSKAFTWRMGILAAFLSSRGEDIPLDTVQEAMKLIRIAFREEDMFKFRTPDREMFINLVTSTDGLSASEFSERVRKAIDMLGEES